MVGNAALLEGVAEEVGDVVLDTHGGEDDGKLFIGTFAQGGLLYDLRCELVVGKPVP